MSAETEPPPIIAGREADGVRDTRRLAKEDAAATVIGEDLGSVLPVDHDGVTGPNAFDLLVDVHRHLAGLVMHLTRNGMKCARLDSNQ